MEEETLNRLKLLPKIDELLNALALKDKYKDLSREVLKYLCQRFVEELRQKILAGQLLPSEDEIMALLEGKIADLLQPRLRRVVNATGIIVHTNLGRAPLCAEALRAVGEVGGNYSNLEYDIDKGERGRRQDHLKGILCLLSGAEDALVVNNNAAAVLLALNTIARGREVIVSRGELVEIGGGFRIPEVMKERGAILREVGTTNKTKREDYENAIGPETALLLKVHRSNFQIVGFTEEVKLQDLVSLARRYSIPTMNDLGSGCLLDLSVYGLMKEPTVQEAIATGVDLVTISGDKLLGGPQAGIILGKRELIEKMERNPLYRALRLDKLTLAALEATLRLYLKPPQVVRELRVLRAITSPYDAVKRRARKLLTHLRRVIKGDVSFVLKKGSSYTGGGALPMMEIPTALLCVSSKKISATVLEKRLRSYKIPVIARIEEDRVTFDLRTVEEEELKILGAALKTAFDS